MAGVRGSQQLRLEAGREEFLANPRIASDMLGGPVAVSFGRVVDMVEWRGPVVEPLAPRHWRAWRSIEEAFTAAVLPSEKPPWEHGLDEWFLLGGVYDGCGWSVRLYASEEPKVGATPRALALAYRCLVYVYDRRETGWYVSLLKRLRRAAFIVLPSPSATCPQQAQSE